MSEHTILPWAISPVRTTEDTAMIVAGDGPDFGLVADVTEDVDAAFILKAVNNHDAMVAKLAKVVNWLGRLATAAEKSAKNCSYESLREGYIADAKNYRATIADILPVLEAAQGGGVVGIHGESK